MATRIKLPTLADMTKAKLAQQDRATRVQAALNRGRVTKAHRLIAKAAVVLEAPKQYTELERAHQVVRAARAKRRANDALQH